MRTLSSTSRGLSAVAILAAAVLVLGGSYFAGFISQLQRDLSDPATHKQAVHHIGSVEKALGYDGFLKTYRNYRLTGDSAAPEQLNRRVAEAIVAIRQLQAIYRSNPTATGALREAHAVADTFDQVARTAPQIGSLALRGTAAMEELATLPDAPQLEAAYLSLRSVLDRLKQAEQAHQLGGVSSILSWSQMLILGALASLVLVLLVAAGLLHLGIIHPLKNLERSLASLGDGNVGQRVWGTERQDEIGQLARASEKLRRSLTETSALKALAENSQLHIKLEGHGSYLFEKLTSDVRSATEALKDASTDLAKLQARDRQEIDSALAKLNQASVGADDAIRVLRRDGEAAIQSVRSSTDDVLGTAKNRAERLDQIAARFEQGSLQMDSVVSVIKVNTAQAVEEFANATVSIKRLAGDTQKIQAAFFSSCDKISSDAALTTEKVGALAAGLTNALATVDNRLQEKLGALDQLEQSLAATLQKLESGSNETIAALTRAAGALDERGAANDVRIDKTVEEFEDIIRLFRDDETILSRSTTSVVSEIRAAQRTIADAAEARESEKGDFAEATARLHEIARRLSAAPAPGGAQPSDALASELRALTRTVRLEIEAVRDEVRDLGVRLTEDRILSALGVSDFKSAPATAPSLSPPPAPTPSQEPRIPQRSLADVPEGELARRLKDLADEMNSSQDRTDHSAPLKAALEAFASEIKRLAPNADRAARLISMGKTLDRHAEQIETHAEAVEPSAASLRSELHAITSELRTIAARAQSGSVGQDGPVLRESAIELGARAESLFSYLSATHPDAIDDDGIDIETTDDPATDIVTLAHLIAKLEARAESLSQTAVADRFSDIADTLSPAEREAKIRDAERKTGGAIHAVYESIERLNNVATALARAGDIERQRKSAT